MKLYPPTNLADQVLGNLGKFVAIGMTVLLLSIFLFMINESKSLWLTLGPLPILTGTTWQPLTPTLWVGIGSMIISTLWIAAGTLVIATPLGLCCAIFLSEFAPHWLSKIIRLALHILTGIPSVVYGFLGATLLITTFEKSFSKSQGESLFCASLVLSIMVIPYIISGSYSALQAIGAEYRESVLSLGISKPYLVIHVLLPMAGRSILSAITLAFGRAMGETMAVLMLAGNTLTVPTSWFSTGEPLSALIALELGSAEVGSLHYQGLFAAGLVLLTLTATIHIGLYFIPNKQENEVS